MFVAYLALSVMGTFAFAMAGNIPVFDFWKIEPKTDGSSINADIDYGINCPAEYTVKTRGYSFSPSRKSAYIITSTGILYASSIALFAGMKIAKPVKAPNSKNTLLLKLRI
jgi:hypothetical protein